MRGGDYQARRSAENVSALAVEDALLRHPRNPMGKVLKRALQREHESQVAHGRER